MVCVAASFSSTSASLPGVPTPPPNVWPTWSSSHPCYLSLSPSPLGRRAEWRSSTTVHLSLATPSTCLPTLAFLPPVSSALPTSLPDLARLKAQTSVPALVTAGEGTVLLIAAPAGDLHRVALPERNVPTNLFALVSGLIVECNRSSNDAFAHLFLRDALAEPSRLSFPSPAHRIIFASVDVPIIVSSDNHKVFVWAIRETESTPDESMCEVEDDPFAAFVQQAVAENMESEEDEQSAREPLPTGPVPVLTRLFDMSVVVGQPVSAFMAHDLRGRLVLCLCIASALTGLEFAIDGMDIADVKPTFCIRDVVTAAPVLTVRRHQNCLDILVRHGNGSMSLFMGRNRLCSVQVEPPPPETIDRRKEHQRNSKDLRVCDAAGAEFGLKDAKGFVVRYELKAAAFSSPLANACLSAVSFTFEEAGIMLRLTTLYHDILTLYAQPHFSSFKGGNDPDWSAFEHVLLQITSDRIQYQDELSEDRMDLSSEDLNGTDISEGTDDDWIYLLNSDFHSIRSRSRCLGPWPHCPFKSSGVKATDVDIMTSDQETHRLVLHALHLVYEEQKLRPLARDSVIRLARLNVRLAIAIGASDFIDHYRRDHSAVEHFQKRQPPLSPPQDALVPCIMTNLRDLIRGECEAHTAFLPTLSNTYESQCQQLMASWQSQSPASTCVQLVRYFIRLYGKAERGKSFEEKAESLLLAIVEDNFCKTDLEGLPVGVALPLQDALFICRRKPKATWPYQAFALIGREDLFNFSRFDSERVTRPGQEFEGINESRALLQIQAAATSLRQNLDAGLLDSSDGILTSEKERLSQGSADEDGCEMETHLFRLRFSEDRRGEEVRRMLRSTDPVTMTPPANPYPDSIMEFDIASEQRRKLARLVRKRYAAPVGRGAYTLRTYLPSDPTKPLVIPKICVSGVLFSQKGSVVTLNEAEASEGQWGEFHNGVAAGLRIVAARTDDDSDNGRILTRAWIVNHRPTASSGSSSHAGMLLALGLGGYLPALRTTDYYEYLIPRHDLTSIGLMLGLAAGNLGSRHDKITKMLCVHIKYFNGPGFAVPDFQVSMNVQTAAILGLGMLHQGAGEHLIVEGLFSELGRRPKPGDNVDDRESLALAAGISIGLLHLGSGSSAFDAADERLIDRLVLYANGGPGGSVDDMSNQMEAIALKGGVGNGPERPNSAEADSEASRVKESNFVNTDVVSPGALLALALVYLKTNERRLADRIVLPDSLYNLDRARPDHVFLRVLAKSLIMWDDISATQEWILRIIPELIRPVSNGDSIDLLGEIAIGSTYTEVDIDVPGIIDARAFATAGACAAIALKYAGTNHPLAINLLYDMCETFERALLQQETQHEPVTWVFMTCLFSMALSLAVIVSGSGNLRVLRLFRRLRKRQGRPAGSSRYGYHLAIHMAIGFLFMGGGCQTFGTSNIAIAGLLCAIYPRFPEDVKDNQFHLQAFRHLYVLAVEPRCIETRDVDTGKPCCVDVEIELKEGHKLKTKAPCIVPEAGTVKQVSVVSERYWPTTTQVIPPIPGYGWFSNTQSQVLFVKRRTGHLPYISDPKGSKGIAARSLSRSWSGKSDSNSHFDQVDHLVQAFSADAELQAFVTHFCSPLKNSEQYYTAEKLEEDRARRHVEWMFECLSNDKADAVRLYMNAERASTAVLEGHANPSHVGSLMLLKSYIYSSQLPSTPLLQPAYLAKLIHAIHATLNTTTMQEKILKYIWSKGRMWPGAEERNGNLRRLDLDFGIALRMEEVPCPKGLPPLSAALQLATSDRATAGDHWLCFADEHRSTASITAIECVVAALDGRGLDDHVI